MLSLCCVGLKTGHLETSVDELWVEGEVFAILFFFMYYGCFVMRFLSRVYNLIHTGVSFHFCSFYVNICRNLIMAKHSCIY